MLEKKLAALIVLNSNRFGKDLARFGGAKRITFKEDLSEVYFYLQSMEEPSPIQWSGKQTIKRNRFPEEVNEKEKEKGNIQYFDKDLCVILAWKEYLIRTEKLRSLSPDEIDIPGIHLIDISFGAFVFTIIV